MKIWAAAVLIMMLLAGCGEEAPVKSADVTVLSSANTGQNVTSAETRDASTTTNGLGHIAGVVVDDALRTIEGAMVTIPALDLFDISDRNGVFEFVDLRPGAYQIRINFTGHETAETFVDVTDDEFTRLKVILHRIPPPTPRMEIHSFEGFSDLTDPWPLTGGTTFMCRECTQQITLERQGLSGVVIEATMEDYVGSTAGSNGFDLYVRDPETRQRLATNVQENPLWYQMHNATLRDTVELQMYPYSNPGSEQAKGFEYFVTAFYNQPIPATYSIVEGTA